MVFTRVAPLQFGIRTKNLNGCVWHKILQKYTTYMHFDSGAVKIFPMKQGVTGFIYLPVDSRCFICTLSFFGLHNFYTQKLHLEIEVSGRPYKVRLALTGIDVKNVFLFFIFS